MKLIKSLLFVSTFLVVNTFLFSQEEELNPIDTLGIAVNKIQSELYILKKLKISGYTQVQYQIADTAGISSYAGGNFPTAVDNRFDVRRGRLKLTYESGLTQSVIQFDITQRGASFKDVFVKVAEPWIGFITLTGGIFSRPISFENEYSSSVRETPERSRIVQLILPGERDLGAKLSFQAPKSSKWNILKLEGGLFNGTGLAGTNDFDSFKDFIGNIGINKTTKNEKTNYGLRFSYYNGGIKQGNKFVYKTIDEIAPGVKSWIVDSSTSNLNGKARREYFAGDFQLNWDLPIGFSVLRAEYLTGYQTGSAASSTSPNTGTAPTGDTYIRPFNGGYIMLAQNILQSKHQLVIKYDWYDPNTEVSKDEIGKPGSKLTATDIKYSTIGIGWNYRVNTNIKFSLYYDLVTNETSQNLAAYSTDLKDNVWTIRMQYKF
ncbi:MAG: porin [Saprospiraceae bacterium]